MFHPKGPSLFELARQSLSSTERGYDLLADKFDYTPFRTPDVLLEAVAQRLAERGPFSSVLDVCCGTGAAMQAFQSLCRDRLVGVDMSREMLRVAKARPEFKSRRPRVEFVRTNALDMPFQDEMDLAVCFGALGHILPSDQPSFVRQVARTLKPGGVFAFVTSTMPPLTTASYWLARGFNAAMHVRNWLVRPPFDMYYLTFLLPEARQLLMDEGFSVTVESVFPSSRYCLVVASRLNQ